LTRDFQLNALFSKASGAFRSVRLLPNLSATVANGKTPKDILDSFEMAQSAHLNERAHLLQARCGK
jgi:hypothetical protein